MPDISEVEDEGVMPLQADRIRAYVLEHYFEEARARGESSVAVRAGDVHKALGLADAVPAVCSVLEGKKLQELASVTLMGKDGPEVSTTSTFTFSLSGATFDSRAALECLEDLVEAGKLLRFSGQGRATKAIIYRTHSGRNFGLEMGNATLRITDLPDGGIRYDVPLDAPFAKQCQLVFERAPHQQQLDWLSAGAISGVSLRNKLLKSSAYSVLGSGLRSDYQQLALVEDSQALAALLEWYDGSSGNIDRAVLERMKRALLNKYPDFEPDAFSKTDGAFFEDERREKNDILELFAEALGSDLAQDELTLGRRLLNILFNEGSPLFSWRSLSRLKQLRVETPDVLERESGRLVLSKLAVPEAIAAWVETCWPVISNGMEHSRPFADSRNLPTLILAMARPLEAFEINSQPLNSAAKSLLGKPLWGYNPLTAAEYAGVLEFAAELFAIMRDEWNWKPKDFWDVQGFIWQVGEHQDEAESYPEPSVGASKPMTSTPTNLILYGPPGTGKTYSTAAHAVNLCGHEVHAERKALKKTYDTLVEAGQIAFVTFHQSYAYEDFVEGLRPMTDSPSEGETASGTSGGFRLEPRNGIFREICALAEQARKSGARGRGIDLTGRQFFKMSLGRAGEEDFIYDAAIEGGYIVLGWGGEVDWSHPKYDNYQAIYDKWNELEPGTSGNSGNIAQVYSFRGWMKEGDIVIASAGNLKFRAIGEIVGPYQYQPTGFRTYNHKRKVKWLLVLDEPLPVETILDGNFSQATCYNLKEGKLKKEALARLLPGPDEAGPSDNPDQFVLVIDEINRANISKVFGELITLIEPDKRLGGANELKVKLPYSGDTFGVPDNLHIVGTMNTADRSIALLDTALRRRFQFTELTPNPELIRPETGGIVDGVNLKQLLRTLNDRIEYLFDRDHQIGHAYLMDCNSLADINMTMRNKVIPLLLEYFYENWERVRQVLGEKQDDGGFIIRTKLVSPPGSDADFAQDRYRYKLREEFNREAYEQLTS